MILNIQEFVDFSDMQSSLIIDTYFKLHWKFYENKFDMIVDWD